MRVRQLLVAAAAPLVPLACSDANQQNYAKAAVATGVAVTAVGVHRAITNDCWARCSPGYLCNEESGTCEPGECLPGCEVGYHCVRDVRAATYCVRDGEYPRGKRARASSSRPDGGWTLSSVPRDASADANDASPSSGDAAASLADASPSATDASPDASDASADGGPSLPR